MYNIKLENRGITLITLVITIIILLILAAVTISLVLNGGLIQQAQNSSTKYSAAALDEQARNYSGYSKNR